MTRWFPVRNRLFISNPRKHHNEICPECGAKRKNIVLHYRRYHQEFYRRVFIEPLFKNEIGSITGVRFIKTNVH